MYEYYICIYIDDDGQINLYITFFYLCVRNKTDLDSGIKTIQKVKLSFTKLFQYSLFRTVL